MHLAPLRVVFLLFYYVIPAYAGFDRKVTFENRIGDSQDGVVTHKTKELMNSNFQRLFVRYCFNIGFRKK